MILGTRKINMRQRKYKYLISACVLLYVYYYFGVSDYIHSRNYDKEFDYPLNIDIGPVVDDVMSGKKPSVEPINYYPYRFLSNSGKCLTIDKLDLFIVVKSAMGHFDHRAAIRKTYGRETHIPDKTIKTLFFLGIDASPKSDLQKHIEHEMAEFKDIIQIDFHDNYFNNTIKTMMSFRWLYQHCSTADFYLFTDDDMYISVKNLLKYVTEKIKVKKITDIEGSNDVAQEVIFQNAKAEGNNDEHLYAGFAFQSAPHRHRMSKWRVSLDEYPWNKWPPYVTAGAYVVSNKSMKILYVSSLFVKHFRFDDIYLGIVAKKAGINVTHCPHFYFYKKKYTKDGYKDVIASHGYHDHEELVKVWNEQYSLAKGSSTRRHNNYTY